jgi:hypothetical protein
MTDQQKTSKEWVVNERLPVTELVEEPAFAPYLVPKQTIRFRVTCPQGHTLPFAVSVGEDVVRTGEPIEWGCGPCGINYKLPLGEWPSEFPPLRLPS